MRSDHRSGCPINLMLEVLGDKWSLMIIRDMIFGNRRHFRELLDHSEEGIASNILADRLKTMLEQGIVTKADDPSHKQKVIYSLTERGIELLPVLVQMAGWGHRYRGSARRKSTSRAPTIATMIWGNPRLRSDRKTVARPRSRVSRAP
jgi:DNA-binding HxlR family transcriptional regulator